MMGYTKRIINFKQMHHLFIVFYFGATLKLQSQGVQLRINLHSIRSAVT